jgi:hypothetical protein
MITNKVNSLDSFTDSIATLMTGEILVGLHEISHVEWSFDKFLTLLYPRQFILHQIKARVSFGDLISKSKHG